MDVVGSTVLSDLQGKFIYRNWLKRLSYKTKKNYTPLETMIRLIPTSIAGLAITLVVGLLVGWVPAIYLLCMSCWLSTRPTCPALSSPASIALGTIATSIACLLFAVIQVNAPYWAFGFPSTVLVVWGADFIFATGALFVSHVAQEDEQSVAGGIYQTCSQVSTFVDMCLGLPTLSIPFHSSNLCNGYCCPIDLKYGSRQCANFRARRRVFSLSLVPHSASRSLPLSMTGPPRKPRSKTARRQPRLKPS